MTQGKIERWHQTLKNRILLENYYLPGDLEAQIDAFVAYYNHRRYHESIDNLTPADVYFGAVKHPAGKRKDQTQDHPKPSVASPQTSRVTSPMMRQTSLWFTPPPVSKISDDGQAVARPARRSAKAAPGSCPAALPQRQ